MTAQGQLEELLKHKGIGPKGSKSLKKEHLTQLDALFFDTSVSDITKATLLTAFTMLDNNPEEQEWLDRFVKNENVPLYLKNLFQDKSDFGKLIQKVVSKENLNSKESAQAVEFLLSAEIPEYQKAVFLESERLKRETHEENLSFLNAFYERSGRIQIDSEYLIDLADNYDGYNRSFCLTPFVACVLSACGFKTLLHGVDSMGPKNGITVEQILSHSGKKVGFNLKEGVEQLDKNGVVYLSQRESFPELFALKKVRTEMVKRPLLATFEKWMQPLRAKNGNYLAIGYTHKAYQSMLAGILEDFQKTNTSLVIRGIEGSPRPPLSRDANVVFFNGSESHDEFFRPTEYGLEMAEEEVDKSYTVEDSLQAGIAVLEGQKIKERDSIIYWAVCLLSGFRLLTDSEAIAKVNAVIDNGEALDKWKMLNN